MLYNEWSSCSQSTALATYDLLLGTLELLRAYPTIGRTVDDVLGKL